MWRPSRSGCVALLALALAGCGSDEERRAPTIAIHNPTSSGTYSTSASGVRIGGDIAHASYVHVALLETGSTTEGFVVYNQGLGTWFADVVGLQLGQNTIVATADDDGTGARTASATLVVTRTP